MTTPTTVEHTAFKPACLNVAVRGAHHPRSQPAHRSPHTLPRQMARRRTPYLATLALSALLVLHAATWHGRGTAHAQAQPQTPTEGEGEEELKQQFEVSKNTLSGWIDRVWSVNTTSPFLREIQRDELIKRELNDSFNLIDEMYKVVQNRRKHQDSNLCNFHTSNPWSTKTREQVRAFQIGFIDNFCHSSVNMRTAIKEGELKDSHLLRNSRKVIKRGVEASFRASRKLVLPSYDKNWRHAGAPFKMEGEPQSRHGQVCSFETVFAYRLFGEWYMRVAVTNHPTNISKPDYERHILQEFVPRNGGSSLGMVQRNLGTDKLENATTLVTTWSGTGSRVENQQFDDFLSPLGQAFRENMVLVDIAADSITISNIAILALPMVMNLIPVAFIAEMNAIGMFSYIVVTDLFSTIPFLVKGTELIKSGSPNSEVFAGFFAGNESLGKFQAWSAQCGGQTYFRNTGIVFVVIALVVLTIGVSLELWAKRVMAIRRAGADGYEKVEGPFGPMLQLEFNSTWADEQEYDETIGDESTIPSSKDFRVPGVLRYSGQRQSKGLISKLVDGEAGVVGLDEGVDADKGDGSRRKER